MNSTSKELILIVSTTISKLQEANHQSDTSVGISVSSILDYIQKRYPKFKNLSFCTLFDALCTNYYSAYIFQMTDQNTNFFFKNRFNLNEIEEYLEQIPNEEQNDINQYSIDKEKFELQKFGHLMTEMEKALRSHKLNLMKNENLNSLKNSIQLQIMSIDNPVVMRQAIIDSGEFLERSRLNTPNPS